MPDVFPGLEDHLTLEYNPQGPVKNLLFFIEMLLLQRPPQWPAGKAS